MAGCVSARRRVWGWYFFDWASQPYATLILTFIFAPYVTELLGDGSAAQTAWGYGTAAAGVAIALLAPLLGSLADHGGARLRRRFLWAFSACYVIGAAGLWQAAPGDFDLILTLCLFGLGLLGMEFATIFTNAMLPELAPRPALGRISGNGWAFGYLGGLVALVLMLTLFAESGPGGTTLLGNAPILGLDPDAREGTRAVGPLTAAWFAVFMIPFFAWAARPGAEPDSRAALPLRRAAAHAWPELRATLSRLPSRPSLAAYLGASMLYRDALNGIYFFGGIYAVGVLGWTVTDVGLFGILAVISAAFCSWLGGRADTRFGPKPVIAAMLVALIAVTLAAIFVSRQSVLGWPVTAESRLPDAAFYAIGAAIGGAGGVLQTASRTMMVRQAEPGRMTEGFGLYALSGKATAFLAPAAVALATDVTGSQQAGITPLIALFSSGLVLLMWVQPEGDETPLERERTSR